MGSDTSLVAPSVPTLDTSRAGADLDTLCQCKALSYKRPQITTRVEWKFGNPCFLSSLHFPKPLTRSQDISPANARRNAEDAAGSLAAPPCPWDLPRDSAAAPACKGAAQRTSKFQKPAKSPHERGEEFSHTMAEKKEAPTLQHHFNRRTIYTNTHTHPYLSIFSAFWANLHKERPLTPSGQVPTLSCCA